MAEKDKLVYKDVCFRLYEKSILVDGIPRAFYFEREVTRDDALHLIELIDIGRATLKNELRIMVHNLKGMIA